MIKTNVDKAKKNMKTMSSKLILKITKRRQLILFCLHLFESLINMFANQLSGFYMRATQALNGLILTLESQTKTLVCNYQKFLKHFPGLVRSILQTNSLKPITSARVNSDYIMNFISMAQRISSDNNYFSRTKTFERFLVSQ